VSGNVYVCVSVNEVLCFFFVLFVGALLLQQNKSKVAIKIQLKIQKVHV